MRREVETIESMELNELAESFFMDMPGMTEEGIEIGKQHSKDNPVHFIRMIYDAQDIEEKRCYLQKENLYVDSERFQCKGFAQLDEKKLKGICIYMATSEEPESTGDLLDDYYLHAWQTACLDAARETIKIIFWEKMCSVKDADLIAVNSNQMRNEVQKDEIEISNSYGPGFYGMDIVELERFHSLVEGSEIGVTMKGQMLYPIKTCTGLYFAVEQGGIDKKIPCEVCIMGGACELCSYGNKTSHSADGS